MQTETLHGIHSVREALLAQRREIHEIRMSAQRPSPRLEEIMRIAKARHIPVVLQPHKKSGEKSVLQPEYQGIKAKVSPYPDLEFADVVEQTRTCANPSFFLLLDQIVDPQNLGALIRTALCAGVDGVILPKDRSAGPTPTVSRASAGAMEHMRVCLVTNMSEAVQFLKKHNIWIAGLDAEGGQSIFDADLTLDIALVVGGEGKGIRPLVNRFCDFLVSVPQQGPVQSLNASAAGAVAMFEVFRQRKGQARGGRS